MFQALAAILAALAWFSTAAIADESAIAGQPHVESTAADWPDRDHATGDWRGRRRQLAADGYDFRIAYVAEGWDNTTGGIEQGALYTGLLKFGGDLSFDKLLPWRGFKASTTWLWLSGQDATEKLVGNSLTTSNIAGFRTWRLLDLWLEQSFGADRLSVRAGFMAWDAEFAVSTYGSLFLNGTFGWPAFLYQNVPGGGPGYPLTGLGARVSFRATDSLTLRSVLGHGNVLSQRDNRHGFDYSSFSETGVLWLNEAELNPSRSEQAGRYTLGAWVSSQDAQSPADPNRRFSNNYGAYFMMDRQLTSRAPAGTTGDVSGLGWFARVAWSPGDRSVVGFYVDTGLNWTGLVPGRPNDKLGVALAWAELGYAERTVLRAAGSVAVGHEVLIETTYSFAITRWLALQPDLQYVIHPAGTGDLSNALVIGARLSAGF
jgi:porin